MFFPRRALSALVAGFAVFLAGPFAVPTAAAQDPDLISISGAYFDIWHRRDPAAEARLEYRFGRRFWIVKPFVGVMGTSDFGGYAYGGILMDLYFGKHFVLTPSFAPGLYAHGSGKDLGYPIEFRSQIEASWRFDDQSRLGLSYSHMSNAHLGDKNPGVESLALTYAMPVSKLFNRK
ncbi:MAG TPA: acyloxyacyl hydrolase [Candidatus Cybelea sp.]|nr:acyloxyacyl hydrolase [Candidatus Cybelea sp.]